MYPERLHVWLHEEFVLGVFQLYFLTVFFLGFLTAVLEGVFSILVNQGVRTQFDEIIEICLFFLRTALANQYYFELATG